MASSANLIIIGNGFDIGTWPKKLNIQILFCGILIIRFFLICTIIDLFNNTFSLFIY